MKKTQPEINPSITENFQMDDDLPDDTQDYDDVEGIDESAEADITQDDDDSQGGQIRIPLNILLAIVGVIGLILLLAAGFFLYRFLNNNPTTSSGENRSANNANYAKNVSPDLAAMVQREEAYSLSGGSSVVMAFQDPNDLIWQQVRFTQAQTLSPAPAPISVVQYVPNSFQVVSQENPSDKQAILQVQRSYSRSDNQQSAFLLPQFYSQFGVDWRRTAPAANYWGEAKLWQGAQLQAVYYAVDDTLLQNILPKVDVLFQQACQSWTNCTPDVIARVYFTNSTAILLEDPLLVSEMPLPADVAVRLNIPNTQAFTLFPAPSLVGVPVDEVGSQWLVENYAVKVFAAQAKQLVGATDATGLYQGSVRALNLGASDAGYQFPQVVALDFSTPTFTPSPTPTMTPTATPLVHIVQSGETIVGIAVKYGLTVELLLAYNPQVNPKFLSLGTPLIIPAPDAALPLPTNTSTPQAPTATATILAAGTVVEHKVQEGDTLFGIAAQYYTSVEAVKTENGITDANSLTIGQVLKITVGQKP
ncbi:MAG TPA: LysM domain-containing protein [Anaerolineales bacterium]|nr:LysM domain-containing protein [Anaerolineales bacterium]